MLPLLVVGTDRTWGPKAPLADCIMSKYTLCILGSRPAISPDCGWCICACMSRRQVVRYRRIHPIEHTSPGTFNLSKYGLRHTRAAVQRAWVCIKQSAGAGAFLDRRPKEERGSPGLGEVSWVTCAVWVNGGREEAFGAFDDAVFGSTEATRHVEASA